jgi:hypothetical protein
MPFMLFDVVCLALVAWVSFRIADEGAFGAVVAFLTVLFAGLFAMNAFEPLAEWLGLHVSGSESWQSQSLVRGDGLTGRRLFT